MKVQLFVAALIAGNFVFGTPRIPERSGTGVGTELGNRKGWSTTKGLKFHQIRYFDLSFCTAMWVLSVILVQRFMEK